MPTLKEIKENLQLPSYKIRGIYDWLSLNIYAPLSRPIIKVLLLTSISANQVTVSFIIIGVIGCILLTVGRYGYSLIAMILIQIHILLDVVDGPIARARKQTSLKGLYIERIGHDVVFTIFFYCIALGTLKNGFPPLPMLTLGFCASFGYFFYKHTRRAKIYYTLIYERKHKIDKNTNFKNALDDKKTSSNKNILRKIYRNTQILWEPIVFINVATLAVIFNAIYIILVFYGLTYPVQFILSYIYQARTDEKWVYEWLKRC